MNHRRKFITYYAPDPNNRFAALCERHGSDKSAIKATHAVTGQVIHTYADFYSRIYDHCREHVRHVFECGLGANNPDLPSSMGVNGRPGASLRVWPDYFPNAEVYGADIDRDILFQEDRIKTFHVDQTSAESVKALWAAVGDAQFDLMVDDGLHEFEGGVGLIENSLDRLRPNGLYIIEDVHISFMLSMVDWLIKKGLRYEVVTLYRDDGRIADNSLIVVRK